MKVAKCLTTIKNGTLVFQLIYRSLDVRYAVSTVAVSQNLFVPGESRHFHTFIDSILALLYRIFHFHARLNQRQC